MSKSSEQRSKNRRPTINVEHMRVFVAIGQARTLTEAAASLQMPLFAVSRVLKRIEGAAQLVLTRRDVSGLHLTGVGRAYWNACRGVLEANQDANDVLTSHREEPEGMLRIGTPLPFARHVLAVILPDFRKLFPKLRVEIALYCSNWNQDPQAAHDVFLKVQTPRDSRHHLRVYPAIQQGFFASPEYLAEHSYPSHPSDLDRHTCLGQTHDSVAFPWKLSRKGESLPLVPNFDIVVSDADVLLQLALRSAGITLLPLWLAHAEVRTGRLVALLEDWIPEPIIFCALHGGRSRIPSKEAAFLSFLDSILGTELDPRSQGEDPARFFIKA